MIEKIPPKCNTAGIFTKPVPAKVHSATCLVSPGKISIPRMEGIKDCLLSYLPSVY